MKLHQKLFWVLLVALPVQLGRHFWPDWSYVFGLKIDYLSPTIYLTDLLVAAILILWVLEGRWNLLSSKRFVSWLRRNPQKLILPFAIFIFMLANVQMAKNPGAAWYELVKIIEFGFLGLYIARNILKISSVNLPLILAASYSSIIALVQFFKQETIGGIFYWLGERNFSLSTPGIAKTAVNGELFMRSYATFPHPNVLAGFLMVVLILTLPGIMRKYRRFSLVYLVLVSLTIIVSFSQVVWLVGLFLGLALLFRKILKTKKFLILSSLSFILFFIIILWLNSPFSRSESVMQRVQLIKDAVLMIQDNPILGVGLNNFIPRLPEFWSTTGYTYWLQPVHNIFLLVAAEAGLIGLALFLWFLWLTLKRLFLITNYPASPAGGQLLIALIVIMTLGLFDHYWLTLQQTQLLFVTILGIAWAGER